MLSVLNSKIENESTVSLELTKNQYSNLLNQQEVKSTEFVVYFEEFRLSKNVMQIKTCREKQKVLGFYKDCFFPIERKTSIENNLQFSPYQNIKNVNLVPISVKTRCIINQIDTLRISIDKLESNEGIKYSFTGEIEYDDINKIFEQEQILLSWLHAYNLFSTITWDRANASLINSGGTKLLDVVVFKQSEPFKWAFKWDGIKHKFIRYNNVSILMNDVGKQISVETNFPFFDLLCHIEEMDDYFVLFEVLNASLNNDLYKMPLEYTLLFLKQYKDSNWTINNKPLLLQQFYDPPFQPLIKHSDGYVVLQTGKTTLFSNYNAIKFKHPTIDGLYIGNGEFQFGGKIIVQTGIKTCITGYIYELTISNSKFCNIRLRQKDRIAPSTCKEFSNFMKAMSLFN